MATAILGLQWGDEGKGKITHLLARRADMVVRFNGGPNAGHTVIDRGKKFGTHLIPAGAFYPDTMSVLAGGVVIDLSILREEIDAIAEHVGYSPDVYVAENAHLILPYHRLLEELEGSGSRFGTTRRGIGPAYRDKAMHIGVRAGDLLRPDVLQQRLQWRIDLLQRMWPDVTEVQAFRAEELAANAIEQAQPILESIGDASERIQAALRAERNVLFEGAQGALLDVDHGSYPFVTSSPTTFAGLGQSIGIPVPDVEERLGIAKAYTTRVGAGPFPTELSDEIGERLQQAGGEYGVTTGRPRRCGWLDGVALRYAVRVNGATAIALTKLDVLGGFDSLRICTGYELDGRVVERFPLSGEVVNRCRPIYEDVAGWNDETMDTVRRFENLPAAAKAYVDRVEAIAGVPVSIVSIGPAPEQTIMRSL